ncbi:hypothetical protein BDA96_10G023800 [Sorghum bicolor]|uniref:Uncharacterized protein n=1 Tax=Sorghum bicolor TaxID=4558 RepID=A0A921Q159_SORBI|nr:hypothetical protein BDA96_10G023800 [Sorghum bicolor]
MMRTGRSFGPDAARRACSPIRGATVCSSIRGATVIRYGDKKTLRDTHHFPHRGAACPGRSMPPRCAVLPSAPTRTPRPCAARSCSAVLPSFLPPPATWLPLSIEDEDDDGGSKI